MPQIRGILKRTIKTIGKKKKEERDYMPQIRGILKRTINSHRKEEKGRKGLHATNKRDIEENH